MFNFPPCAIILTLLKAYDRKWAHLPAAITPCGCPTPSYFLLKIPSKIFYIIRSPVHCMLLTAKLLLPTQDTTNHVPLFEETCRLLYLSHPEDLLTFVNFAQLVRDHKAQGDSAFARKCRKDFFFHRALNALPKFVSSQDTPTSAEAVRAYCQLLLNRSVCKEARGKGHSHTPTSVDVLVRACCHVS